MKRLTMSLLGTMFAIIALQGLVLGQVTGSITGSVADSNGAVVPGATIEVRGTQGENFNVTTNDAGLFRIPAVAVGTYTITVTASGFKKSIVNNVKVDVGTPASAAIVLAAGNINEVVEVSSGADVLQTETATVGTTLTGRQITDIPTASRDALDLVLAMPGTATPGRPRTSTVNGLPKGALNITIDGLNVQDNLLRSSDGFFTYIRPRTDAIGEVTVSTSNPGAESSGEGAVQIKFVTENGGNDYRGGLYWYHRNPALNTNYWFSNRDLPPDPVTGKAPQQRILLNQFGGKVGGPISIPGLFSGKDRAFFFVNYEEFRLPEKSPLRTRTILSPQAQTGIHRFLNTTNISAPQLSCVPNPAPNTTNFLCSFDTLARAATLANSTMPGTADPRVSALLGSIRGSLSGLTIVDTGNPNLQQVSFYNTGGQVRKFPTVRLDFKPFKDHHIENIWNYQDFRSQVDFLNGVDPSFPGFPNFGSQDSIRFSNVTAWRWNVRDNIVNEARFGALGGTSLFFPQVNASQFDNQGGASLAISAAGVTNATIVNQFERRNSPVKTFTDTLTWTTGNHAFSFGGSYTRVNLWRIAGNAVPTVNFGLSSTLEASNYNALVAGLPAAQQAGAAALWSTIAGRISSVAATAFRDEDDGNLVYNGTLFQRAQQNEFGFFGQDSWKIRPNLTLTMGLRWEVQGPFIPKNNTYSVASYEAVWGESGVGNLFKPGTLTGAPTVYTQMEEGTKVWETDKDNIAPSLGVAWTPNWGKGWAKGIFGDPGQTVIRGGYSRAFVREGTNTFLSIIGSNPGASISATRNITGTPFALPLGTLLRNGMPAPPSLPASLTYPYAGNATESVNVFDPKLEVGYVDSYTIGIQRELTSNMAIEFRYVSNRGKDLWRQYNLNELNVIENGFLDEFKLAQQNFIQNVSAGRGANFRYFGPGTNTNPLPTIMAYFTGLAPTTANANNTANYSSSLFANTTFTNTLNTLAPSPTGFAGVIAGTANASLFEPTRVSAGIPVNFFYVNPSKRGGGAFVIDNSSKTWYDAFQFEFRRRLSQGLLVQMNYTFSKSLTNTFASSSVAFDQPATLRTELDMRRGHSPFDVTHSVKTNFIWEVPVGRGKWLAGGAPGWVDQIIGGWGLNGNIRWQSGTPFSLGNVQLIGMTLDELQDMVGIYKGQNDAAGVATNRDVYFLPLEVRQNTYRAFNVGIVGGVSTYTQGAPTGKFIAPAGYGNCMQAYSGQCGFQNLVLKGPDFFRADISVVKRFRFNERVNLELRGEFLNAFNNINFIAGAAANDVNTLGGQGTTTFARYTAAYQDTSTTNDPGGRLTQIVLRLNF